MSISLPTRATPRGSSSSETIRRHRQGPEQVLQEFTGTYEYKWPVGLLARAEYRYDWANTKFFNYGNDEQPP